MASRSVHLVGSYPADDTRQAMTITANECGRYLRSLPDGEVGDRRNWIVHIVEAFRRHPDLELARDGDWSGYDNRPLFKVKPGRRLTSAAIDPGHAAAAKASYLDFRDVRTQNALDQLTFQVGIPGDLDLGLFTFGTAGAFTKRALFRDALAAEMGEIATWGQRDVLFQLEIPVELIMVATAPAPLRGLAANFLASSAVRLVAAAPPGSRFGIHLCLGDLNHRALKRLTSTAPLVALTRALVRSWPRGRDLEYVHLPLAAGDQVPATQPTFYRDMGRLASLPPNLRIIAGLVHEDQDLDEQIRILRIVESYVGRPVDVATACGMGRRGTDAARQAVQRAAALAQS